MLHGFLRCRDASQLPPLRESRVLFFAKKPKPSAPTNNEDDDDENEGNEKKDEVKDEAEAAAEEAKEGEEKTKTRKVDAISNLKRRQAERILRKKPVNKEDLLKPDELLSSALELKATIASLREQAGNVVNLMNQTKQENAEEARIYEELLGTLQVRIDGLAAALEILQLEKWERGELTPSEFLANLRAYFNKLNETDALDPEVGKEFEAEKGPVEAKRIGVEQRAQAREQMYKDATETAKQALKVTPSGMPMETLSGEIAEKDLWKLYNKDEKEEVIRGINRGLNMDLFVAKTNDDIQSIREAFEKKDLPKTLQTYERKLLEITGGEADPNKSGMPEGPPEPKEGPESSAFGKLKDEISTTWKSVNDTLGIRWTNFYELREAFQELFAAIKTLKKGKRMMRVAENAATLGKIASYIPGLGGQELEKVLDRQESEKMDEVKDKFVKELKDQSKDYGFADLFGKNGDGGMLATYARRGDTNRTRAILEFAAGKSLLYDMERSNWKDYVVPGGIPFRNLVPINWPETQVDTYFSNLGYSNTTAKSSQREAGQKFAKGRNTVDEFIEVIDATANGLSLYFARGVIDAALEKVSKGEMSAMITLTILDIWQKNDLFRKYVTDEWLDSLPGDHKPMMVGMLKFDRKHLLAAAKGKNDNKKDVPITRSISKAHDGGPNQPRLGPLVAAVRRYIDKMAPDIKDAKKKKTLVAQILASKTVQLENGTILSIWAPELKPFHYQNNPTEAREANTSKMGDDFFIERSEVIRSTGEVMASVGTTTQNGFAEKTKAQYFFSHIIDNYDELTGKKFKINAAQGAEMAKAAQAFVNDVRPKLENWIAKALNTSGAGKVVLEQHMDQKGRLIIASLVQRGLISMATMQKLAGDGSGVGAKAASTVLKQVKEGAIYRSAS